MTGFSALPLAEEAFQSDTKTRWSGSSKILGPAWSHLPSSTLGLLGVQIFWSVEMSYGDCDNILHLFVNSVRFHSFPVSDITGPDKITYGHGIHRWTSLRPHRSTINRRVVLYSTLNIYLIQLPGVLADNCKSRFGRRRPYMIGGSLLCVMAMLLLGFTRPVATVFTSSGSDSVGPLLLFFLPSASNLDPERHPHHLASYIINILHRLRY